jgi:hypothetical protein
MPRTIHILSLLFVLLFYSCTKVDKIKPIVSLLEVNGKSGEIIYVGVPKLIIDYEVSDDILVVDSKIKLFETNNTDSGYISLNIQSLNTSYYRGVITIIIPDSIFDLSIPLTISIDGFDDSGNQADQLKSTIKYR